MPTTLPPRSSGALEHIEEMAAMGRAARAEHEGNCRAEKYYTFLMAVCQRALA
jgi:hypothetical protein